MNDDKNPKKLDGNGKDVKEPPKKGGGLKIDVELPPSRPDDKRPDGK